MHWLEYPKFYYIIYGKHFVWVFRHSICNVIINISEYDFIHRINFVCLEEISL